jgi:OFA family oxalate/formate antiporter-like MFS transporter
MARLAGTIKDMTGSLDYAFYLSAAVLIVAVVLVRITKRPIWATMGQDDVAVKSVR